MSNFKNEIKSNFSNFVNDPENKPWKHEVYGTKFSGKVTFSHFVIYALLRGVNPEKATHDPHSERYKAIIAMIQRWVGGNADLPIDIDMFLPGRGDELASILRTNVDDYLDGTDIRFS